MAIGDRIILTPTNGVMDDVVLMVYGPRIDETTGEYVADPQGAVSLLRLGGVKAGSAGCIVGAPFTAQRTHLAGEVITPTMGGFDFVKMYPIRFDAYPTVAWVPAHQIKIVSGAQNMDRPF